MQVKNIGFRGMHIRKVACLWFLAVPGLHLQTLHPGTTRLPRTPFLPTDMQQQAFTQSRQPRQETYIQHLYQTNTFLYRTLSGSSQTTHTQSIIHAKGALNT